MLLLALALAGGVVVAPADRHAVTTSMRAVTSVRAGLVVAAAGSSMFWMRRVSNDARTPGQEAEAVRMLDAARPIGALGAFLTQTAHGVVDVE